MRTAILLAALALSAHAARKPFSADDVRVWRTASDARIRPDGRWVVYVEAGSDGHSNLWVASTDGKSVVTTYNVTRLDLDVESSSLKNTAGIDRRNKALKQVGALEQEAWRTMQAMRRELVALWARSMASSEHLVMQLHDWCLRAEASGIAPLVAFSRRLRTYS